MEHKNKLKYDNQAILNLEIKDLQTEKLGYMLNVKL